MVSNPIPDSSLQAALQALELDDVRVALLSPPPNRLAEGGPSLMMKMGEVCKNILAEMANGVACVSAVNFVLPSSTRWDEYSVLGSLIHAKTGLYLNAWARADHIPRFKKVETLRQIWNEEDKTCPPAPTPKSVAQVISSILERQQKSSKSKVPST